MSSREIDIRRPRNSINLEIGRENTKTGICGAGLYLGMVSELEHSTLIPGSRGSAQNIS